ncbi:efflux RND transporter periplasmic adaptor subunit [Chitinophaga vietnamensis]|uniref:efflux RND transporter periplasmic adaptor subunit n=1 Tax=Chitinophaga vietnamensis TaxID=2593957 RepID=UPI001375C5BD|nr:efflux RND transporter periplasmic adaptor subunit [Chitinophaga vietnamensis]
MKMMTIGCCAVLLAASCNQKPAPAGSADYELHGDTIRLKHGSPLEARLRTATVEASPYRLQLLTAGIVKAIPNNYAEIAPPFSGRVLKSFMRLGEQVNEGAPLFEISSPDFIAAQKAWFQAKQLFDLATTARRRQQDLLQHGVGAQKDFDEATANAAVQQKEFENAQAALQIYKVDPKQMVLGQPLTVRAPIHGEVIDNRLVTGQFIKSDGGPVAIVAELSKVWIAGQVREKDIRFIRENDDVTVDLAALPDLRIKGKIFHIGRIVDETTRAIEVLMVCDNPGHQLKPGMYANVHFIDPPQTQIRVPATAIMQQENSGYVFVEAAPGAWCRRKVTTGETDSTQVIITGGLQPGEKIITQGGFYLSEIK